MIRNILKVEYIKENDLSLFKINSHSDYDYHMLAIKHLSETSDFLTNAKIAAYTEMYLEDRESNIINESLSGIFEKLSSFIKGLFSKAESSDTSTKGSKSKLKADGLAKLKKISSLTGKSITLEGYKYNILASDTYDAIKFDVDDSVEDIKAKCHAYFRNGNTEKQKISMNLSEFEKYVKDYDKLLEYDLAKSKQTALKNLQVKAEGKLSEDEVNKLNKGVTLFYSQMIVAVKEYGQTIDLGIAKFNNLAKNKSEGSED